MMRRLQATQKTNNGIKVSFRSAGGDLVLIDVQHFVERSGAAVVKESGTLADASE